MRVAAAGTLATALLAAAPDAAAWPPAEILACPSATGTAPRPEGPGVAADWCGLGLGYWNGPEVSWVVTSDEDTTVELGIAYEADAELDLVVLAGDDPSRCVTADFAGARRVRFVAEGGRTYRILADDRRGGAVPLTFALACGRESLPPPSALPCGATVEAAAAGASTVSVYAGIGYELTGPETVYLFRPAADGTAVLTLEHPSGDDFALVVLDPDAPARALAWADRPQEDGSPPGERLAVEVAAGRSYLAVVDGAVPPRSGALALTLACLEGGGEARASTGCSAGAAEASWLVVLALLLLKRRSPARTLGLLLAVAAAAELGVAQAAPGGILEAGLTAPSAAAGRGAAIDAALSARWSQAGATESLPVIVILAGPSAADALRWPMDAATRRRLWVEARRRVEEAQSGVRELVRARGVEPVTLALINGMAAAVTPKLLAELAAHEEVAALRWDAPLALDEAAWAPVSSTAAPWGVDAIGAPLLWAAGSAGAGAVVAVLDSGVDLDHPAVGGRWRGGPGDWLDPHGEHPLPFDAQGHGTQVTSIIVGGGGLGVAPESRWIAAKIFDDSGTARVSTVHRALEWALDPDGDAATDDAPDIVNCSFGFGDQVGVCRDDFTAELELLRAADIQVVFAAGNGGPASDTSESPANNAGALAVGAFDSAGGVAGFSARGPSACAEDVFPTLLAPGVAIRAADLTFGGIQPESFAEVSGTSFAAPHVSGALALLRSASPAAPAAALEEALVAGAFDGAPAGADPAYGFGMLDLPAAYRALVPCADADGDGFPLDSACAPEPDCDDGDAARFPGASEITADGVDQDCNGHDLTITVEAGWFSTVDHVEVLATSVLDATADLRLEGLPMRWDPLVGKWRGRLTNPVGSPRGIVVSGIEGRVVAPLTIRWRSLWRAGALHGLTE